MSKWIKATTTYCLLFSIFSLILFAVIGIVFLILDAELIAVIICMVGGVFVDIIVLVALGRLLMTRIRCSTEGIECSYWLGLSKSYLRWENCVGYGLLNTLPSLSLYGIKYLYFSDRWYISQNDVYKKSWVDVKGELFHP